MQIRYLVLVFLLCSCSDFDSGSKYTDKKFGSSTSELEAFDGYFAGFDMGEWGGKLVFLPSEGTEIKLLDKNVVGIFKAKNRIVVFTGLAHLGSNKGEVYTVAQNSDKSISVALLITLPGAPLKPIQRENGEVLFGVRYLGEALHRRALFKCYLLNSSAKLEPANCGTSIKFGF